VFALTFHEVPIFNVIKKAVTRVRGGEGKWVRKYDKKSIYWGHQGYTSDFLKIQIGHILKEGRLVLRRLPKAICHHKEAPET